MNLADAKEPNLTLNSSKNQFRLGAPGGRNLLRPLLQLGVSSF